MNKKPELKEEVKPEILPVIPLRGLVLYPKMMLQFDIGRAKSLHALNKAVKENKEIFLVPQKNFAVDKPTFSQLNEVGVVASIRQVIKQNVDSVRVVVEGMYRAKIDDVLGQEPYMKAKVAPCAESKPSDKIKTEALIREIRNEFGNYIQQVPKTAPDVVIGVESIDDPGHLADFISAGIMLPYNLEQKILNELNVNKRLSILLTTLIKETNIVAVENEISAKTKIQIDKNQREYFLREQIKIINEELGDSNDYQNEVDEFKKKILKLNLDKNIHSTLIKECDKLAKMPIGSHEGNVVRNYLDMCISLPWNKKSKINIDILKAQKVLDRDHYGLDKVKERIIELLAVRKIAPEIKGQIICLVGPPGVGKTSIAKSIAKAVGIKYARISLGGIKDESDIRGHRRTYIGAMQGRIISAIKQAGTNNPLILLDEIDKLSKDFSGDPTSALLEVLDPEQNNTFHDHYIDLPFDLSDVFFITTANNYNAIPAPLRDRMEIIELQGYTLEEKFNIAKKYLITKQIKTHGLKATNIRINKGAIYEIINGYTKESGVRTLERTIASLLRKIAKQVAINENKTFTITEKQIEPLLGIRKFKHDEITKNDEIGVATGLAWTSVGGETLPIEVAVMDGSGKIQLTGSLGDVMKESANAAISYVRANAVKLGINANFYKDKDIHIHAPEGAVPKDGPSAGITMAVAIVSALSGRPVKHEVAMTGEITLRGRVLPIGGLKEKTMAAYCNGIKTVIIPNDNKADLQEIDSEVKKNINFILVSDIDKVLEHTLKPQTIIKHNKILDNNILINTIPKVSNTNAITQTV